MNLRAFIGRVDARIVRTFQTQGRVDPMYHIVTGSGRELMVEPPTDDDKDFAVMMVRKTFAQLGVKRSLFVTEAWIAQAKAGPEAESVAAHMRDKSLKDLPGRKEVIMYSVEDEYEGALFAVREIIRDGDKATLGPLQITKYDVGDGLLLGLLPNKGKAN